MGNLIQLELSKQTYDALRRAALEARKSEAEFAVDAIEAYLAASEPLIGLFANDPALIDEVLADAMQARKEIKWRLSDA